MLTAFRGGTQFRKFGSDLNVGNIFQQDRGAGDSVAPHHGLGYLVYLVGRKYAAYDIFIAIFIEYSTIGIQVHFAGDVHHFAQCHAVMAHPFRVQLHLIFLDVAAQCATPPVESRRGRMVQSAMVRKSSIEVESAVRPTISISPKMDDCGPSVGLPTLAGKDSLTTASFSLTICRAR